MLIRRIVIGLDGSAGSRVAADWAADLAQQLEAEVIAVHVLSDGSSSIPDAFEGEWCRPLRARRISYRTEAVHGAAAESIMEVARQGCADLIVVGTRGHRGLTEMVLGSVSHQLTHESIVPVVVVPPLKTVKSEQALWSEYRLPVMQPAL